MFIRLTMNGLEKVCKLIKSGLAQKIVVMAGAGISTPSGLPDFRSPGSGLYSNLEKYNLPYPEAVFDIGYFKKNPKPFFQLAKSLYPGQYPPNEAHWFVRLLQDKNLLLRMYTQNIDGIETLAGIKSKNLVEAHGSFSTATCRKCLQKYKAEEIKNFIFNDEIPTCKKCKNIVKPDIVFFGEMLPEKFMLHMTDMPLADLLIVMGTSLEVQPFAGIVDYVTDNTPRLLINKEVVGSFFIDPRENDYIYKGDVVKGIRELCKLLNWDDELTELILTYTTKEEEAFKREE